MEQRENLLDVLKIFYQWLKPIAYLCLAVGLGTALISLLLSNYYESTTTFYANSIDQAKPGQIFGTSTRDIEFYGDDRDNDRLLTIAESNELKDYMIQTFDLYRHYEIDSTKEKAAYNVRRTFNKHYTVLKTKRDAIQLSVEDTDKALAKEMVNTARERVNELAVKIVKEQLQNYQTSLEKNIEEKNKQLQILDDSIQAISARYGVYNTETQGEIFATQILTAESQLANATAKLGALKSAGAPKDSLTRISANIAGYQSEVKTLKKSINKFNEGQSKVLVLERRQKDMSNKLGEEGVQLNQLKTAYNSNITAINLIEAGTIPLIKSRPK
ncbi:MAG: hypothetical protein AAGJ18_08425, partial [Bacteroidota bacterium]